MFTFLNESDVHVNADGNNNDSPTECTVIEEVGSTGVGALTIAFLIFVVAAILFIIKANGSKEQRRYYAIAGYICSFSAISYFAMLSGQGWIPVTGCRQLFWARYVEWLVTFPLVLVLLGSISGADNDAIAGSVGSAVIFVITSYVGSVSVIGGVKWVWFLLSLVGIVSSVTYISREFKAAAEAKGTEISQLYGKLATISSFVWLGYPLVWLFAVGFYSLSVSFEVCAYAVLDLVAKALVCFLVLSAHDILGASASGDAAAESQQFV